MTNAFETFPMITATLMRIQPYVRPDHVRSIVPDNYSSWGKTGVCRYSLARFSNYGRNRFHGKLQRAPKKNTFFADTLMLLRIYNLPTFCLKTLNTLPRRSLCRLGVRDWVFINKLRYSTSLSLSLCVGKLYIRYHLCRQWVIYKYRLKNGLLKN